MAPWGRRPGGGGVGRLRLGGDDRAGTVPPAPGGTCGGRGGGAGVRATRRRCVCVSVHVQIVHVRTEVRQRIQGACTPPLVACTHPYTAYRLTPYLPSLREVVAMLVRASRSVEILSEIS